MLHWESFLFRDILHCIEISMDDNGPVCDTGVWILWPRSLPLSMGWRGTHYCEELWWRTWSRSLYWSPDEKCITLCHTNVLLLNSVGESAHHVHWIFYASWDMQDTGFWKSSLNQCPLLHGNGLKISWLLFSHQWKFHFLGGRVHIEVEVTVHSKEHLEGKYIHKHRNPW